MAPRPQHRRLKRTKQRRVDVRRVSASEAGYDWQWSKPGGTADQARERDEWLCCECVRIGGKAFAIAESIRRAARVTTRKDGQPSEMPVDHILPAHVIGPDRFHDIDNLQTLCERHHGEKTDRDQAKYGSANR